MNTIAEYLPPPHYPTHSSYWPKISPTRRFLVPEAQAATLYGPHTVVDIGLIASRLYYPDERAGHAHFEAGWQEGVEAVDEVGVATEEATNSPYHSLRVNIMRFELKEHPIWRLLEGGTSLGPPLTCFITSKKSL